VGISERVVDVPDSEQSDRAVTSPDPADAGLMRGTGLDLGPLVGRFPFFERTLVHVLRYQARERPDKPWLIFDSRDELTFGGAEAEVNRVANALSAFSPESTRMAVMLRNQIEFFPGFLGAIAQGGVAMPFNPELRGALLERLLVKSRARVLMIRADLLSLLGDLDSQAELGLIVACGADGDEGEIPAEVRGVPVVRYADWLAPFPTTPPATTPSPTDPGALMFTSGTTGGSKGAVSSNHYLYLFSAAVADSLGHTPDDVLTTPLQACHVAGLHVIANSALHVGCTAHMKSLFSASSYWDEVAADGATFSMIMGQMAGILMKTVPSAPPHQLEHLYTVPFPGFEFEKQFNTRLIWQAYGLTESFPHLPTKQRIEDKPPSAVGYPPKWFDYGVVDENDRLLPPGEPGELVYRPRLPYAMFSGYDRDDEITVKTFRNFMFHTGDMGFYDEDGCVHFIRRMNDTIRRGGENISAVELESVAATHPQVVEAAAYGVASELGGQEVKLDVVVNGDLKPAELHSWLAESLPRYMVPRYIEQLGEMPKTPSARIEKYKLRDRGVERPEVASFEPPRRRPQ
jgi:carnitine-CoA ligase